MDTVKLRVTELTGVNFRNVKMVPGEGLLMSQPQGKIYLEPGKEYDCTVINDACIQFLDSLEEAVFCTHDLKEFVRSGVLTITDPYSEKHEPTPSNRNPRSP